MTMPPPCRSRPAVRLRSGTGFGWIAMAACAAFFSSALAAVTLPVTPEQRSTARKVAEDGVPLSELAPNAPDSHTVRRGDTLWGISGIFLKRPWRWPELWGMNLEQIRNPHLIYPGQVLYLDKSGGRARLRMARPIGDVKLSPQARSTPLDNGAIASIEFRLIEPFLNEAVIFETDQLAAAPRIVAAQEGRVLLTRGDLAYVRGDIVPEAPTGCSVNRAPCATRPPARSSATRRATSATSRMFAQASRAPALTPSLQVPATFRVETVRQEANVGDRLAPVPPRDYSNYAPRAPAVDVNGQIVSIYGDSLTAGQNQIVALNRGARNGIERGHVLALWRAGEVVADKTVAERTMMKLPDERHGLLFVFQVFDRMSYALILSVQDPVRAGDRFSQP